MRNSAKKPPTPIVSLPIEKRDLLDDVQIPSQASEKATLFLAPHPEKRIVSPFLKPQNTVQKNSKINVLPQTRSPSLNKVEKLPLNLSTFGEGNSELPQYHLLSKSDNSKPESLREELQKRV